MASPALIAPKSWQALHSHLRQWFYRIDTQAMACNMACVAAHFYRKEPPVWLFVVGPSSSGKTRVGVDSFGGLNYIYPMGDITAKTFISASADYKGLLTEIGDHGVLTFKDFTTILSKREDERGEIAAQLREIYDGKFNKRTGMGVGVTWQGKITVIAGATNALERAWAIRRELGERFLTVRWPTTSDYAGLRLAASQRGRDPEINKELERLVMEIISNRTLELPKLPTEMVETTAAYAQVLARMRGQVYRDREKQITDLPVLEDSYRIHKQLLTAIAAHAALWHRTPEAADLAIARRLSLDSIPMTRRMIFDALRPLAPIHLFEIAKVTKLPDSTVQYHLEDLLALGVTQATIRSSTDTVYTFNDDFLEDLKLAELVQT